MIHSKSSLFTLLCVAIFSVSACSVHQKKKEGHPKPYERTIRFGDIGFVGGYHTSNLKKVEFDSDQEIYRIDIEPEAAKINPSPWYAFKVVGDKKTASHVQLTFSGYKPRYSPWISTDGENWGKMDRFEMTDSVLNIYLPKIKQKDTLWISAQQKIDSHSTIHWLNVVAKGLGSQVDTIGYSAQNKPIVRAVIGNPEMKKVIVVLGRQHPPEVTGYFGLKYFMEYFLQTDPQIRTFLEEYTILLYPLANPDGVDQGSWRFTSSEKPMDLNRDWGLFSQKESATIGQDLERVIEKHQSIFEMSFDFHSTFHDVFYIVTEKEESKTMQWLTRFEKKMQAFDSGYKASYKANAANAHVYKNWFYKKYNADAITYEVGDNTNEEVVKEKGQKPAQSMIELLNAR